MQWIGYLLWGAYYGVAAIFVWRCTHSTSHKWIALPFMYVMRAASTPLDEYADAYLLHPNVCGVLLEHTAFSCRKWTGILATNPVEYVASRVQDAVVSDVKSVSFWVTLLSLTPLVGIGYYVAPKIRKWGNSRALRASLQKGVPLVRHLIDKVLNALLSMLFGVLGSWAMEQWRRREMVRSLKW